MDMMDTFILIQAFITGWIACRIYMAIKLHNALKRIAEENGISLEDLGKDILELQGVKVETIKVSNMFTELTGNTIYLYKDSGDFVGQADSLEQLAENLYNYDKVKFASVKHKDQLLWFVEGKVKSDLKDI